MLSIRKDKLLVVDIEATCWEGYDAPIGQENEIIEIGICLLDMTTYDITAKQSILVRPTRSVISPFCTQLTTLTQELVDTHGIDFDSACRILESEYDSHNRLWASWGSFDQKIFLEQCKNRHVRYPFFKKYVNLKRVFQDNHGTRLGLSQAIEAIGLTAEGTAHRGSDDAYNVAQVLIHLLRSKGNIILRRYGL